MSDYTAENEVLVQYANQLQQKLEKLEDEAANLRVQKGILEVQMRDREDYIEELERVLEYNKQAAMGWAWDLGANVTQTVYCVWCQKKLGSDMAAVKEHVIACRETHTTSQVVTHAGIDTLYHDVVGCGGMLSRVNEKCLWQCLRCNTYPLTENIATKDTMKNYRTEQNGDPRDWSHVTIALGHDSFCQGCLDVQSIPSTPKLHRAHHLCKACFHGVPASHRGGPADQLNHTCRTERIS